MTETQGISHVFVSEGGQRKLKYRAERQNWTVWQLKHYSNIYLLNIIFTLCCGNIQLISFSLKKKKKKIKKNYFIQFTFYM